MGAAAGGALTAVRSQRSAGTPVHTAAVSATRPAALIYQGSLTAGPLPAPRPRKRGMGAAAQAQPRALLRLRFCTRRAGRGGRHRHRSRGRPHACYIHWGDPHMSHMGPSTWGEVPSCRSTKTQVGSQSRGGSSSSSARMTPATWVTTDKAGDRRPPATTPHAWHVTGSWQSGGENQPSSLKRLIGAPGWLILITATGIYGASYKTCTAK